MPYANNKCTDQPVHLLSLISAFLVCFLDSVTPLVSISEISNIWLVSVASVLPGRKLPKTGFLVTRLLSNTLDTDCTAKMNSLIGFLTIGM